MMESFIKKLLMAMMIVLLGSGFVSQGSAGETPETALTLTLGEALKLALEKNKDIQKAQEYRNLVKENTWRNGSPLYPN